LNIKHMMKRVIAVALIATFAGLAFCSDESTREVQTFQDAFGENNFDKVPEEPPQSEIDSFDENEEPEAEFMATGCNDKTSSSTCVYWKGRGYCSKSCYRKFMETNCEATCGFCSGDIPNPPKATVVPSCADTSTSCAGWKRGGHCGHSYVKPRCKKTCGLCASSGGSGSDTSAEKASKEKQQKQTAAAAEKSTKAAAAAAAAEKSTKAAAAAAANERAAKAKEKVDTEDTCQDDPSFASRCAGWKRGNYCDHSYVKPKCKKTCGHCKSSGGSTPSKGSGGSSGGSTTTPSGAPTTWTKSTNTYRCMHGVNKVTWDARLAQYAKAWADQSARGFSGSSPHDPKLRTEKYNGQSMGENMAFRPTNSALTAANAQWYNEVGECTNFPGCTETGAFTSGTGHFTALVWKGVTKIGCAVSNTKATSGRFSGYYFYVCRYWPAPNMRGQFTTNVFKKVKDEDQCK